MKKIASLFNKAGYMGQDGAPGVITSLDPYLALLDLSLALSDLSHALLDLTVDEYDDE